MKPSEGKKIIDNVLKKGGVRKGDIVYTAAEAKRLNIQPDKPKRLPKANRTGWIDDELNLRNKAKYCDTFDMLVKLETGLEVWNEFSPNPERKWRIDKALPIDSNGFVLKIALEIEGGVMNGGRHTRPIGFLNDMEKYNYLAENGWTLIRVTPSNLVSLSTIESIKKLIANGK